MAIKILSVDDEQDLELLLTQYFRRKIRHGEYEFIFAHNGLEALEVLLKHPDIDIILSDINMPEMDGLTLLSKINEMRNPAQKCIMVSAYGDMDNIRHAMNNGAFDFATKPIDLDDLQRTIDKAVEQIEYIHNTQAEHKELLAIHDDLTIAREIQQAILPHSFTLNIPNNDAIDIYATMLAAKDVGGDFYDFYTIDETHIGFTIADVSGKGVPAAIYMAVSRTMIKANGKRGISPEECMRIVNNLLCEEDMYSMFVTALYGIYETDTGKVEYCNAGHDRPYIFHANGNIEEVKADINLALGVMNNITYTKNTLILQPGDALITYTDGVPEAEDIDHNQFGTERLVKTISKMKGATSKRIVEEINKQVKDFAGQVTQFDDITQLIIKRNK